MHSQRAFSYPEKSWRRFMAKEVRTRSVDKKTYKNYLKKAGEFHKSMQENYDCGRWNATVADAVHCEISCCDAVTSFYLGFRHAGERHLDALELLKRIDLDKKELNNKIKHFISLVSVKNLAEYEDRLMNAKDAATDKKACDRFYSWVIERTGR
jgi:hypothetical protein